MILDSKELLLFSSSWPWLVCSVERSCWFVQRWYLLMMVITVRVAGSRLGLESDRRKNITYHVWSNRSLARSAVRGVNIEQQCSTTAITHMLLIARFIEAALSV